MRVSQLKQWGAFAVIALACMTTGGVTMRAANGTSMPPLPRLAPAADASATATAALPLPSMPSRVRTISLNLKDANVVDIFRLLAEQNNLNVIVSPEISSTISLRLNDVSFDDAMKVVLDASNTQMKRTGKILYIYPRQTSGMEREDFVTEVFDIHYVDTNNLMPVIQPLLSPDARTQTFTPTAIEGKSPSLIISDIPENIEKARKMIERLDVETPQILIEAKIVSTNLSNDQIFGADWSIVSSLRGSPFEMKTRYAQGGIQYGTLDLSQISAIMNWMKTIGKTDVLSDIQIATLDGKQASILVGEKIPVGVSTLAAGAGGSIALGTTGVQEYKVGVNLTVTPVVLGNEIIQMNISPDVSAIAGFTSLGSGVSQAPITTSRTAETNILVRSGESIVIGGLMQDTMTVNRKEVPVLSRLPFVGGIFRSKTKVKEKSNLIIFITARIMSKRELPPENETTVQQTPAPATQAQEKLDTLLESR